MRILSGVAAVDPPVGTAMFDHYADLVVCPICGEPYPAAAGTCPRHLPPPRLMLPVSLPRIPDHLQTFVDAVINYVDNGKAPRSAYGYGYENTKLGMFQHIPVCDTLKQLTDYFNGGASAGSVHFGVDRAESMRLPFGGRAYPFAQVDQYMPIVGAYAPWAQGIINSGGTCAIPWNPVLNGMRSGEPNPAYLSVENVARTGSQGMTDAQFNSNVMLRAMGAAYFGYGITPNTQLWHAEVDRVNRCSDPGWSGDLEDEAQAAAILLLGGWFSGLRAGVPVPAPAPTPTPPAPAPVPTPTPARDYHADYDAQLRDGYAAAVDDVIRFQVRQQHYRELLKAEAINVE